MKIHDGLVWQGQTFLLFLDQHASAATMRTPQEERMTFSTICVQPQVAELVEGPGQEEVSIPCQRLLVAGC